MPSLRELNPALDDGIKEWVKVDNVPDEKRLPVEELLVSSSLARLVFEVQSGLVRKDTVGKIRADEEFIELWKPKDNGATTDLQKKYFEKGLDEYAKYLAFGAPFSKEGNLGVVIAGSPVFMGYIELTRRTSEVGPAFLEVLDVLPYTDLEGLKFFARNREVFAALDQEYFAISGPNQKTESKKAKQFREFSDRLIMDSLFLFGTDPKWREFVRNNFALVYAFASSNWFALESNNPLLIYKGLEEAYILHGKTHGEDMDAIFQKRFLFKMVAPYFSGKSVFAIILERINEGVKVGSIGIVESVYRFASSAGSFSPDQKHLLDAFFDGKITYEQLQAYDAKLKSLEGKIRELIGQNQYPYAEALKAFINSGLFFDFDPSFILDYDILPTEAVVSFLREKGQDGIKELIELKEKTKNGQFDHSNLLQRDLEFMKFLKFDWERTHSKDPYKVFSQIKFEDAETAEESPVLDPEDEFEARAAAFEVARVYWMIRERTDKGRKVIVVGNNRYGRLFVTEPMRSELELLSDLEMIDGIGSKYVRSHSGKDIKRGEQIFSDNNLKRIASTMPDIIVIDGTQDNTREVDGKNLPRFSSAMRGFYHWALSFNEGEFKVKPRIPYGITFKSFIDTDQIVLEDHDDRQEVLGKQTGSPDGPQVIIINATVDPAHFSQFPEDLKAHEAGYFDDPEEKLTEHRTLVFTKNGLEERITPKKDLNEYVHAVQKAIEESLLEMIMSKSSQSI